eukprot:306862_1
MSQTTIHSYTLQKINQLRKAEGQPSWQSEMLNNGVQPLHVKREFSSRVITYQPRIGNAIMTTYGRVRRLISAARSDELSDNNNASYFPSMSLTSSFAGSIAYLPSGVSLLLALIAIACIASTMYHMIQFRNS